MLQPCSELEHLDIFDVMNRGCLQYGSSREGPPSPLMLRIQAPHDPKRSFLLPIGIHMLPIAATLAGRKMIMLRKKSESEHMNSGERTRSFFSEHPCPGGELRSLRMLRIGSTEQLTKPGYEPQRILAVMLEDFRAERRPEGQP